MSAFGAGRVQAELRLSFDEIRPGIWAMLQPEASRFNDSNSVVLISDEDVIVVDSQANPATVRALIAAIRERTDKPVRYLVNTHFHSDHTRGNFVYRKEFGNVEIVGHRSLIDDIPKRAAPDLDNELTLYRREIPAGEERLAQGIDRAGQAMDEEGLATLAAQIEAARAVLADLESIEWIVPTLAVEQSLTFNRSVGPIEVRTVHAHTPGDLVVYLPDARVLVTGDVLDDLPYGGHGYPSDWVAALNELEALDWEVLIPGHGQVRTGDEAREHLRTVRSLFELMISSASRAEQLETDMDMARSAFLESEDLEPLRRQLVGDDPVAEKAFDDFVPASYERALLEAQGRLPD